MKRLLVLAAAAITAVAVFAGGGVAGAQDIVIDTGGFAAGDPGTRIPIADETVDAALVGGTCSGTVTAENNASTHPNNDLVIATGGQEFVIADVEGGPNDVSTATGGFEIGESLTVELEFGDDGLTSGGLMLTITCTAPAAEVTEPVPAEPAFTG